MQYKLSLNCSSQRDIVCRNIQSSLWDAEWPLSIGRQVPVIAGREQRELPVHSVHAPIKNWGILAVQSEEGNESLLLTKEERMARCLVGAVERHQRTSGSLTA